jgi:hypothetical protein
MRRLHTDDRRSRTATARLPAVPLPRPYLEAKAFTTRAASRIRNNFADHNPLFIDILMHLDDWTRPAGRANASDSSVMGVQSWHKIIQEPHARSSPLKSPLSDRSTQLN